MLTADLAARFTQGTAILDVPADSVRQLYRALDNFHPGLGTQVEKESILAIDGELLHAPYMQCLDPNCEIYVFPKMAGG